MPDDVTLPNVRLYYLEGKWRLCGHNRKPLVHAKTGTPVDGGGHLFKAKAQRQAKHVQDWYRK